MRIVLIAKAGPACINTMRAGPALCSEKHNYSFNYWHLECFDLPGTIRILTLKIHRCFCLTLFFIGVVLASSIVVGFYQILPAERTRHECGWCVFLGYPSNLQF